MKLYVWYKPTLSSDFEESLREKVFVGSWDLRPIEGTAPKEILVCRENLQLPDASRLSICAAGPGSAGEGLVTIGVSADGRSLCHFSGIGCPLFATVASGSGGFVELRILSEDAGAEKMA